MLYTVKPVLSSPSNRRPILVGKTDCWLNYAGQKYCRMLHSAILSHFIKLPFATKTFACPLKTAFNVP